MATSRWQASEVFQAPGGPARDQPVSGQQPDNTPDNTRLELAQAIRKDHNRNKGEAPAFHAEAAVPATIHCRIRPLMSLIGKAI
jgi:hypothetical protein